MKPHKILEKIVDNSKYIRIFDETKPKTMPTYNEKRAFNVYMTFAGVMMALMVLCISMCSCNRGIEKTNPKYTHTK